VRLSSADYHKLLADLLGQGLTCETRVRGKSMQPTMRDGDLVTLHPPVRESLRPGDIVLCVTADGRPFATG